MSQPGEFARYARDKIKLDDLNRQIEEAPRERVPVFEGIAALHDRVRRFERKYPVEGRDD